MLNLAQNLSSKRRPACDHGDLNRVLRHALDTNPPPLQGKRRPKIYFATQVATDPPTIVLFTNGPELFDNTYQRYLIKHFRDQLPFPEVPIKIDSCSTPRRQGRSRSRGRSGEQEAAGGPSPAAREDEDRKEAA